MLAIMQAPLYTKMTVTQKGFCIMSNIAALVDDYGLVSAQIAELEIKKKAIRAQLLEAGEGPFEGDFYRVTVSHSTRETLDMKAVRAKLSTQFIVAHTTETDVITLRASVRTGVGIAA